MENKIPVLITTDKRGVFFGLVDPKDTDKNELHAEEIQMCVYWASSVRGVLGLAANGPDSSCRVTAPVPKGFIKGVTLICECSEKAVKAWKKQQWKS